MRSVERNNDSMFQDHKREMTHLHPKPYDLGFMGRLFYISNILLIGGQCGI
jgi:hypothetical protein